MKEVYYISSFVIRFCLNLLRSMLKDRIWSRLPYTPTYKGRTLAVLANGPSLKDDLRHIEEEEFQGVDFSVMNYFALDPLFCLVKPKYYCFADPMFFAADSRIDTVRKLFKEIEEKVDWDMTIFIPNTFLKKRFLAFSQLTNAHLTVVPVNTVLYSGRLLRSWFYRHNFASPCIQTVAILNVFTGLNLGYSRINLYGADMTFFESMKVDAQSRFCMAYRHFTDKEEQLRLEPYVDPLTGKQIKIATYLSWITQMFKSHDDLADYARRLHAEVFNHSPVSLLDAYPRQQRSNAYE